MKSEYVGLIFDLEEHSAAVIFEENVCKFTSAYPHKCNMNFELVLSRLLLLCTKFRIAFAFTDRHSFSHSQCGDCGGGGDFQHLAPTRTLHISIHNDNYKQNILQTSIPAIIRLDIRRAYIDILYVPICNASTRTRTWYLHINNITFIISPIAFIWLQLLIRPVLFSFPVWLLLLFLSSLFSFLFSIFYFHVPAISISGQFFRSRLFSLHTYCLLHTVTYSQWFYCVMQNVLNYRLPLSICTRSRKFVYVFSVCVCLRCLHHLEHIFLCMRLLLCSLNVQYKIVKVFTYTTLYSHRESSMQRTRCCHTDNRPKFICYTYRYLHFVLCVTWWSHCRPTMWGLCCAP